MLWKNYEEILQNYLVYVYPRSKELHRIIHEHIIYTQPNLLDISSTLIREKIKKGENIADFIHPRVLKIIEQEKLYK
jgi:nicotinate-nucleotide adenylyltransferase